MIALSRFSVPKGKVCVNQDRTTRKANWSPPQINLAPTYYTLLELEPSASVQQVRRAYREKSKLYHPDTTTLPAAIATEKFRQLNEAYATLSSPERRQGYDHKIGFAQIYVAKPSPNLNTPPTSSPTSPATSLDPNHRPLSPGELFALFILGVTFVGCLILALFIGLTRGETAFQSLNPPGVVPQAIQTSQPAPEPIQSSPPEQPLPVIPLPPEASSKTFPEADPEP